MTYATPAQLQEYLGESVSLPSLPEQTRLLQRASEEVDHLTLGQVDTQVSEHVEAARNAVCAIVELWLEQDESAAISGPVQSYSIGSLSMTYGQGNRQTVLPRRARSFLFNAGLLYRGVRSH